MAVDPLRPPSAVTPRSPRERARPANALGLVLSTRTAAEAARGTLLERLLELRPDVVDDAPLEQPCDAAEGGAGRVLHAPERDRVRRAAGVYVRTVVADGVAPADAAVALRAIVREGAAFLPPGALRRIECDALQAARDVG